MVLTLIRDHGVQPYGGSVRYVRAVAGRAGSFGFVVGVDRVGQGDALTNHGADVVVTDLAELLPPVSP